MKHIVILAILVTTFSKGFHKDTPAVYGLSRTKKLARHERLSHAQTVSLRDELSKKLAALDAVAVINLLDQKGVDPNKAAPNRCIPLIQAIRGTPIQFVETLLNYHADPNKYCWKSETSPIFEAIKLNKISLLKKLIVKGALVESTDSDHNTPLTFACSVFSPENNTKEIIIFLMHAGAHINHRNLKKDNALSLICTKDHSITKQLIDAKADLNNCNSDSCTPLAKVVLALTNAKIPSDFTTLIATATLLLAQGADPDHCRRRGYTARTIAEEAGITYLDFPPKKDTE